MLSLLFTHINLIKSSFCFIFCEVNMTKLVGKKIRITQIFKDNIVIPVSVINFGKEDDLSKLKIGDLVKVVGISKGKGFQGVVKRHGFHGGPKSHGQKDRLRAPGSIGSTGPQRVMPGKKMPGRMGGDRITLKGLKIVDIDNAKNRLLLKGALPGNKNGRIEIHYEG